LCKHTLMLINFKLIVIDEAWKIVYNRTVIPEYHTKLSTETREYNGKAGWGLRGHTSALDFYGSFTYILPSKDRGILVLSFRQKAGEAMGCPKLMQEYYNEGDRSANISEGATNFLSRLT